MSARRRSARFIWFKRVLAILILVCLVVAGMQPRWVDEPISLPSNGRDLLLAVDISGSMGTEDMRLGQRGTEARCSENRRWRFCRTSKGTDLLDLIRHSGLPTGTPDV